MAKRKNRAARKQQRERVGRAEERGLPTLRADESRAQRARRGGARRSDELARSDVGRPAWLKVLIGAVLALIVVFFLAQSRKQEVSGGPPALVEPAMPTAPAGPRPPYP